MLVYGCEALGAAGALTGFGALGAVGALTGLGISCAYFMSL